MKVETLKGLRNLRIESQVMELELRITMPIYLGKEDNLEIIDGYISRRWDEFEDTITKLMKAGWDLHSRLVGETEKGKHRILNRRWFRWGMDSMKIRNRYRCPLCSHPSSTKPGGLVECMNKKCRNYHLPPGEEKEDEDPGNS